MSAAGGWPLKFAQMRPLTGHAPLRPDMKITRNTLLVAFARMLDERIDGGMLLSHSDLVEDWHSTGLRAEDLDYVLEHLYAMHHVDRTVVGNEPWYRLTPTGAIELRICRESFWERLRDRLSLLRLRGRHAAPRARVTQRWRRRADRIADEAP